jgi:RNA ligase (TIGR02306 family)
VVRLGPVEKHPNADTLGVTRIWSYTAIVRLGEYKEGDLVAYIEPDYVVPDTEQFSFLGGHRRIKARRLRGLWSQGLVIPAPPGANEGDDVMEQLGVARYEPPAKANGFHSVKGPNPYAEEPHPSLLGTPKYDLEPYRRYSFHLEPGEPVWITEKLHGTNARFAFRDGKMWCGARTHWRKVPEDVRSCWWWGGLAQNPWIEEWCRAHPEHILFGEVFGDVQDLKYGSKPGQFMFRAFDALSFADGWMTYQELRGTTRGNVVPLLHEGPLPDLETLEEMSRRDSTLASHVSEGIVIKPHNDRDVHGFGRVALKLVSDRYLERCK